MIHVKGKGGISAKIIADSINEDGKRITTFQLRYHRYIHGEVMTHRVFSRNASSSRAIPVAKLIEQVRNDPATPIHWGINQPGMQAKAELTGAALERTMKNWKTASLNAAALAELMNQDKAHKQIVNRILEPFQFMETVLTATEFDNYYGLRIHKDAQPEIDELAKCMKKAIKKSKPELLVEGEWHLPYVLEEEKHEYDTETLLKLSVARCARVSYLNHDKSKPVVENDINLYKMLADRPYDDGNGHVLGDDDPVHLSPTEHQATTMNDVTGRTPDGSFQKGVTATGMPNENGSREALSGNFKGWVQYRQLI